MTNDTMAGTQNQERKAEPMPAPKPLTIPESLAAFRAHTAALRDQLARGSKSDLDQVGARLDELVAWMDALIDEKHHNPASIRTIHVDPVAEHAAAVKAEEARVAAEKSAKRA
jgi:hypothetical protein